MSLQVTTNINVDFYDKKYILINAKQLDKNSRFLSVTCYNHGDVYPINAGEHSAYIRYRKADDYGVFNFCKIDNKGKILIELTEQMLSSDGICYADLVIVNKGSANVDAETGEIITIDNASVLSTMTFCIDVSEVAIANSEIESSYEFDGLNTALQKAEAEYAEVIQLSRSYAIGDAGGIRENENYDNAKYYYKQSLKNASDSATSALNASNSEKSANEHMRETLTYSQNAQTYMTNAKTYMNNASASEANAKISETNAKTSEVNASVSETNAKVSEENALDYKEAVETINNNIISSINTLASSGNIGSFISMGKITFEKLISLSNDKKAIGYVYSITDDFITDDSFVDGAGLSYTAGTNVYYTTDGYWDCLGGASSPTATVNEVKKYLELPISFTIDDGSEVNTFIVVSGTTFTEWIGSGRVISETSGLTLYCYNDGAVFADEAGVYALSLNGSTAVFGSDEIVSGATYTIINWGG